MMPDFSLEQQNAASCRMQATARAHYICGVDEAGRGPLAGPVVAAALVWHTWDVCLLPPGIQDSKKLSKASRTSLFQRIQQSSDWAVGVASVEEIDQLNILQATKLAMQRAVSGLPRQPEVALIDGNQPPILPCRTVSVVKGDNISLSIAAASIIAKVTRDGMMEQLATTYPMYGFERHAGYGTALHLAALKAHGACPAHRTSFAPVREAMQSRKVA